MADPENMIIPLLQEMRADITDLRKEMNARFDVIENTQKSFKHALTADSLMGRLLTGEFEERIVALERKMRDLETTK